MFSGAMDFGAYLAGMAMGHNMTGRRAIEGANDDWSFTVDELLRVTALIGIPMGSATPRGRSQIAGFMSSLGAAATGGMEPPEAKFEKDGEGVHTVRVVITQQG